MPNLSDYCATNLPFPGGFVLDSSGQENTLWDSFVLRSAEPHPEQFSTWGNLRRAEGWFPVRVYEIQGRAIVGGVQFLEHRVGRFLKIGYVARGPLLDRSGTAASIIAALKHAAKQRGLTYLALSLPYFAHDLVSPLLTAGFSVRPTDLPPSQGVQATVVLDLTKTADVLSSQLRRSRRQEIRRGKSLGIEVRLGTQNDIPRFLELVAQLCTRRNVRSNMPGGEFPRLMWEHFHPRGQVQLFLAEWQGRIVAALMVLTVGEWARAWRIGVDAENDGRFSTQVLFWESICWAQQNRFKCFEIVGFDLDDAKEMLAGRPQSAPFKCQISFFKAGWGGRILVLPGEFCFFPNPIVRCAFRCGGKKLFESQAVARLTHWIHATSFRRR